jgi:hypothetical protein
MPEGTTVPTPAGMAGGIGGVGATIFRVGDAGGVGGPWALIAVTKAQNPHKMVAESAKRAWRKFMAGPLLAT